MAAPLDFSLDDKYLKEEGRIILSGLQALVRLPLDQHRADARAGLRTASLISGYRGSPLGSLDLLLERNKRLLDKHHVVFLPGVNEDLGATAVFGSQLANLMPDPAYDGVLGMWYGKGPGVDRTGDAFKHANFTGVGRYGGVLAVAGDDPISKSSTLPTHSEIALYDARMPILFPGNVQEVIEYGRYGFELSRFCGCWVGFKIVTDVADGFSTAEVAPLQVRQPEFSLDGKPWRHRQDLSLLVPFSLRMEKEIQLGRMQAARLFAARNRLNRMTVGSDQDRIGLMAAGKTYYDLHEALHRLGLQDEDLRRYGIRLLKLGMIHPLEPESVREFARGLEELIVVEEKRSFIELFVREELYNLSERPQVLGKKDERGRLLIPSYHELDADAVARLLAPLLAEKLPEGTIRSVSRDESEGIELPAAPGGATRAPYFCSGCPHNRSTLLPDGSVAGGGIGCHTMAMGMGRNTQGVTQMGGEGAQWVGASLFSGVNHLFQNLGDGTLFHSGHLAIRQAIAAGTNITYKILYNSAVAMTGGQSVDGALPVPDLTRSLEAEGVGRIIVCSHDTNKYPSSARWARGVEVWPRERLEEAQRALRAEPGVTVLIYDQPCAAEQRRKRKRGLAPIPSRRVMIHEEVCEGCGDCGVKSNCLSLFPVETEYGRKTRVHQSSCNLDFSCLEGDCPAFVTIELPGKGTPARPVPMSSSVAFDGPLPDPELQASAEATHLYLTGIGGTGVVTVSQILSTAALLEGRHVSSLDQTGLSQMAGPVVSHLKITRVARPVSGKIGRGEADALLMFDVLTGSTDENLARARPGESLAVVSTSQVPTGGMIHSIDETFPEWNCTRERIDSVTRPEDNVYLDARGLAEQWFGSHMPANLILVGAAFQAGVVPLRASSIERAIELNRIAVDVNLQAFRNGRLLVADPDRARALPGCREDAPRGRVEVSFEVRELVGPLGARGGLLRLLEDRTRELIDYQSPAYARRYLGFVHRVLEAERGLGNEETPLTLAVGRYLYKLMAYKDEYEVARLYRKPAFREALKTQFGSVSRTRYMLHPPFLRALGWKRKIAFGRWFEPALWLLSRLKVLRGTRLDLFGYGQVRRTERRLIQEYCRLMESEIEDLSTTTLDRAVAMASLPDRIRGYEQVKLDNVARFREEAHRLKGSQPKQVA